MKQFELVLKNDREKAYRRISHLLLIINLISIVFATYLKDQTYWGALIIAIIAAAFVLVSYYFKNKNVVITHSAAFFLFSLGWQIAGYWVPAALNLVFLVLNGIASKKPVVTISKEEITYPSFPKKQFHWKELNNIILKDGLLSIDFKNNKLIQQLIDNTHAGIDEKEFNNFCEQQLNK
ncbi:MAG TPA: hypothetical protein VFP97_07380 [Chitinophagaceae bacterium]|nr:hypothetical protein [Chitinophagaceae bacterium]